MRLSFTMCVVEILGYVNMDVTQCEENCIKTDYSQKKKKRTRTAAFVLLHQ